jgi:hypothetical protein
VPPPLIRFFRFFRTARTRLGSVLSSIAWSAWGLLIGLAFVLMWPVAVIVAPVLWAWEWISGRKDDDDDL